MNYNEVKALVIGAGISGIAAVNLLTVKGAKCILFDQKPLNIEELAAKIVQLSLVEFIVGELTQDKLNEINLCVLSPGVKTDHVIVQQLRDKGVSVLGEIELAYRFEQGSVMAVTGTNGKTTTTTLLGEIMKEYQEKTFVVGNIGIPYTKQVLNTSKNSITVAELSSFQLETIHHFCPHVASILNVTPDHIDHHYSMENYVQAKEMITKNQTAGDYLILNALDEYCRQTVSKTNAKVVWFSSKGAVEEGFYSDDISIYYNHNQQTQKVMNILEMHLLGTHNVENVMAAMAMATAAGVPMDVIVSVVKQFKGVEHRIEYVATRNGVDYYNDSKGTNPDAAIKAVQAMRKPTYLIGGGYDKGVGFGEWIDSFDDKIKKLFLIGETARLIEVAAKERGFQNVVVVDSLEEAVRECSSHAKEGDAVLLSPACASWGMFTNYEERGNLFKQYVLQIKE